MDWFKSFFESRKEPKKRRERQSLIRYPETAIISIASHGMIQLEQKSSHGMEDIPILIVPEGLRIIKYSEIPPGTCNMMTDDKLDEYIEYILEQKLDIMFQQLLDSGSSEDVAFEYIFSIVKNMVPKFMEMKQEIVTEQMRLRSAEKGADVTKYIYTHDKGYLTGLFHEGDTMLNKY
jgi:hypothetical protein